MMKACAQIGAQMTKRTGIQNDWKRSIVLESDDCGTKCRRRAFTQNSNVTHWVCECQGQHHPMVLVQINFPSRWGEVQPWCPPCQRGMNSIKVSWAVFQCSHADWQSCRRSFPTIRVINAMRERALRAVRRTCGLVWNPFRIRTRHSIQSCWPNTPLTFFDHNLWLTSDYSHQHQYQHGPCVHHNLPKPQLQHKNNFSLLKLLSLLLTYKSFSNTYIPELLNKDP